MRACGISFAVAVAACGSQASPAQSPTPSSTPSRPASPDPAVPSAPPNAASGPVDPYGDFDAWCWRGESAIERAGSYAPAACPRLVPRGSEGYTPKECYAAWLSSYAQRVVKKPPPPVGYAVIHIKNPSFEPEVKKSKVPLIRRPPRFPEDLGDQRIADAQAQPQSTYSKCTYDMVSAWAAREFRDRTIADVVVIVRIRSASGMGPPSGGRSGRGTSP